MNREGVAAESFLMLPEKGGSSQHPWMVWVEVQSQGGEADGLTVEVAFLWSWSCPSILLEFMVPLALRSGLFSCPGLWGPNLGCDTRVLALWRPGPARPPALSWIWLCLPWLPLCTHTPPPQPWEDLTRAESWRQHL